ncbi:hypothetical protein CDAIGKPJ_01101 [Aeromonas salmonicida]
MSKTTFCSNCTIHKLKFQCGSREAGTIFRQTVTTSPPTVTPERELIFFVNTITFVNSQISGTKTTDIYTDNIPSVSRVKIQGKLSCRMAQVGVILAILSRHIFAFVVVMRILSLFAITFALKVENSAAQLGIISKSLI